ncbi:MAG: hypothetical protein KDB27_10395, partial [Planctomycetales bacterium]|nr:hypothetical protein [Planctomycetales bacterium]
MSKANKLRGILGDLLPPSSDFANPKLRNAIAKAFDTGLLGGGLAPGFLDDDDDDDYFSSRDESEFIAALTYLAEQSTFDSKKPPIIEYVEVNDDDYVSGRFVARHNGRVYRPGIFVDFDACTLSTQCSCGSTIICDHVNAFADYLLGEMKNPNSKIRDQIIEDYGLDFDEEQAPPGTLALRALDQLIQYTENKNSDSNESETDVFRIAWRITYNDMRGSMSLTPQLQKQKKRGGGWTKGRQLNPDTMRDNKNVTLTATDSQVLRERVRRHGYYAGYEWEMVEALDKLVGYEHVELDDQPATVVRTQFGLKVESTKSGYEVKIDAAEPLYVLGSGYISIDEETNTIYVCKCDDVESKVAELVYDEDLSVPKDGAEELKQRLQTLAKSVSVRQPAEFAGDIEPADWKPVLKLLSTKEGQLQCGIRVRTNDILNKPGEGVLLLPSESNGIKIQLERDHRAEQTTCRALVAQLGLTIAFPVSDWEWRFTEFEESLAFLSLMESKSEELGIEALWDEESVQALRMVGSITAKNVRVEVSRKKDWFGLEGGFSIGEHEFSLPELLSAIDSEPAKGYTELRPGMWAKITERLRNRLRELRDVAHKNRSNLELDVTAIPVVQSLLESELDVKASKEWQDRVQRLEGAMKLRPKPSKKLNAELRDYQSEGYRWMRRLAEWGVGGVLADDMGLGKTVQALAVLLDRAKKGPALVIAPTSVGFNWQREAEKFTPSLNAYLYRETERAEFLSDVKKGDIVVCSYGLALRDAEALSKVEWGTLILDEAQFVKNSNSKTAQAIRRINADWKLALTGTPMENHLGELWSIFRTISPGLFGSWDQFRKRFASPIEKEDNPERRKALSRLIRPFVLRRTKSEVLKDLPERTEINLQVDLSDDERKRYDEMRLAAVGELDEIVGLPDTNDQRFRVLAILTRLRQMACHIGLVDESWEGESAKLNLLVEKVTELKEEGHRVLIFSQFTKYLDLIRKVLVDNNVTFEYLDGKTSPKARQERVDRFQEGNTDAFLISLKAGGTGLNLTAADYVIHMDPWWNPAVE